MEEAINKHSNKLRIIRYEMCYNEKGKDAIPENESSHDLDGRRSLGKNTTTK